MFKSRIRQDTSLFDLIFANFDETLFFGSIGAAMAFAIYGVGHFIGITALFPVMATVLWWVLLAALVGIVLAMLGRTAKDAHYNLHHQNHDYYLGPLEEHAEAIARDKDDHVYAFIIDCFQDGKQFPRSSFWLEWNAIDTKRHGVVYDIEKFEESDNLRAVTKWNISDSSRQIFRDVLKTDATELCQRADDIRKEMDNYYKSLLSRITVNTDPGLNVIKGGGGRSGTRGPEL